MKKLPQEIHDHPSAFDHAVISWVAPEYVKHEKGIAWKITAIALTAVAAVLGIIYGAWTFSLAIITFAIVYYLNHLEHPKNVDVKISNIGIKMGKRNYPYGRIKSFWIIYEPPYVKTLTIKVTGEFLPEITIQLNSQDPAEVREFLIKKIPEVVGKKEATVDTFLRAFKI